MLNVWQTNLTASHLTKRSLALTYEKEAFHLHSTDGKNTNSHKVLELKSLQEEIDTCVILYCMYTKQKSYKNARIRTSDSDIFLNCLYYAKTKLQGLNVSIDSGNNNGRLQWNLPKADIL